MIAIGLSLAQYLFGQILSYWDLMAAISNRGDVKVVGALFKGYNLTSHAFVPTGFESIKAAYEFRGRWREASGSGRRLNTKKSRIQCTGVLKCAEQYLFQGHTDWVRCVCFANDGKRIVSGSDDLTLRLWDSATGTEVGAFQGHLGPVLSVAFSPDDRLIASGSWDRTVRIWDADTYQELCTIQGYNGFVERVSFGPDSDKFVSAGRDAALRLWSLNTRDRVQEGTMNQADLDE